MTPIYEKDMSIKAALKRLSRLPSAQERFNIFTSISLNVNNELETSSGPLKGLLFGIKDNIVTKDMPTTCGSKILLDYKSPFDATVVDLLKKAGAVAVGKTNLDEFGMGSGGVHSHFGPTFNPLYKDGNFIAGGSSSGSAAAVAADVVDFSLGTDTGGSVRLPAAYTSILGFKPSYGRISRHGVVAYAQSLDTVGIMSKDLNVLQRVFRVLDKYDPKDPTSLNNSLRSEASKHLVHRNTLKIGVPMEMNQDVVPFEIRQALLKVIESLMAAGHEILPVSLPSVKNALPIYYTLAPAEAVSNLARYDGIRYGYRDEKQDIEDGTLFVPTRRNFGSEVQNRIVLGNYNLCSGSFKNNYIKAQKLRVELINQFDDVFRLPNILTGNEGNPNGVDMLLSLASMSLPISVQDYKSKDMRNPLHSYINDIFTMPMSLAGLPTLTIPAGNNMKGIGVQLSGQYGSDQSILNAARTLV